MHGLQGHPYKTWASRKGSRRSSSSVSSPSSASRPSTVFWPKDLLPTDCPDARILVYGYDTKISKYLKGATNQNSILSHSKDLLFSLGRERDSERPLIFIAHSLGGIIVKEVSQFNTFPILPFRFIPSLAQRTRLLRLNMSTCSSGAFTVIVNACLSIPKYRQMHYSCGILWYTTSG